MKRTMLALFLLVLCSGAGVAQAPPGNKGGPKEAQLGVSVEAVSPALYSQLLGILSKGQGVLIAHVEKNSPATKAGLLANDILLTYGDQKLYAPEQLVKLIRGDKPGHEVAMEYLRGGKTMNCKVMLGEKEPSTDSEQPRVFRFYPGDELRKAFEGIESKDNASNWDSFDEMKLTRLDANRWRATIDYRAKDGKKQEKNFTGTREEIRKDILAEKDLPANERGHLLRALNLHDPIFEFHFPSLGTIPEFKDRP